MAGGNRYKHRSLGGGLVPNKQQAPQNNFYVAPAPEPSMLEKALQLAQGIGDASSEYIGKANADPGNRLSPFGVVPTQFIKDSAKHLWDEKFGLVPAQKAFDAGSALADILSGKQQSTPFASAQGTQLAGDVANNATVAALDASTLIPGMGVVPKMGKGAGKAAVSMADDVAPEIFHYGDGMVDLRFPVGAGEPATISGSMRGNRLSVDYMNVPEAAQRQGVGTKMHDALIEWGKKNGVEGIDSDSVLSPGATALYDSLQRKGYGVTKNVEPTISNGSSIADGPIYSLDLNRNPTTLGMGFPFGGKDGEKPLLSALMDAFKGKPKESPLDQFTPPKSLDDIFTGGSPRGAREITGGAENPAGMESSFFNDPRFNGPQEAVPYNPESGFGGLDAKFAADKNARTLSEALAKRAKPPGYDDWSPEWRAAYDKGLPMDTASRMARAREQGFTTPAIHNTASDFEQFDPSTIGRLDPGSRGAGFYFNRFDDARRKYLSKMDYLPYANEPDPTAPYPNLQPRTVEGGNARPSMLRMQNPITESTLRDPQVAKQFADAGYENIVRDSKGRPLSVNLPMNRPVDFVTEQNYQGPLLEKYAKQFTEAAKKLGYDGVDVGELTVFDPANIRSTSAAFDPANQGKPTLLGMGAPFEGKPISAGGISFRGLSGENTKARMIENLSGDPQKGFVDIQLPYGQPRMTLAKNPDPSDLKFLQSLGNNPRSGEMRFVADADGNMYVGDAYNVEHSYMRKGLKEHGIQAVASGELKFDKGRWHAYVIDEYYPEMGTKLGAGLPIANSDLIKLLMAYGAFGGMSAGALATLDSQRNAQRPGM